MEGSMRTKPLVGSTFVLAVALALVFTNVGYGQAVGANASISGSVQVVTSVVADPTSPWQKSFASKIGYRKL